MSSFNYIDESYIKQAGITLPRFKDVGNGTYNCRCIYCGDSAKSDYKARGYFYTSSNNNWRYKCHNCAVNVSFSSFIEFYSPELYRSYKLDLKREYKEIYKVSKPGYSNIKKSNKESSKPVTKIDNLDDIVSVSSNVLNEFTKISDLDSENVAVKYLKDRSIPEDRMANLYYTNDVSKAVSHIPSYKGRDVMNMAGIILPYFNNGILESFQIRNLDRNSNLRYLTFDLVETTKHIFNFENINPDETVYVFEGAFDSMFCSNGIAASGASIMQKLESIKEFNKNIVVVFDNDYKTNDIIEKLVMDVIESGYHIVIFDDEMNGFKDINEYAKKMNKTRDDITSYLEKCTYFGRGAKLKITSHKRTHGNLKWTSGVSAGNLKKKAIKQDKQRTNSIFSI